jgi:hypothetical protein
MLLFRACAYLTISSCKVYTGLPPSRVVSHLYRPHTSHAQCYLILYGPYPHPCAYLRLVVFPRRFAELEGELDGLYPPLPGGEARWAALMDACITVRGWW